MHSDSSEVNNNFRLPNNNSVKLRELSPKAFEALVASVLESKGYNISLTRQRAEDGGGLDIIALPSGVRDSPTAFQIKHHGIQQLSLFNETRDGSFEEIDYQDAPHQDSTVSLPTLPMDAIRLLSMLLSPNSRQSFIGDLEERYGLIVQKKGRHAANVWFWRELIQSLFSLALDAIKRLSGLEWLYRRIGP